MLRPTSIWRWNYSLTTPTYSDLTSNVNTDTDFSFLANANDKFYFGFDRRWTGLFVDLSTNGSYAGITYEYYNGDTWKSLSLIDSYSFSASKYVRWNLPNDWIKVNFTTTFPHASTPPDTNERYWIRIYCTSVTTTAVIDKVRCFPFVSYATATDISDFLQTKKPFDELSKPTDLQVEKAIRRAEDRIDYRSKKSWRFTAVTDDVYDPKLMDYNRYGIFTRHRNLIKIYSFTI